MVTPVIEQIVGYTSPISGLPKLKRDKAIRAGTKFLWDGTNPYCKPAAAASGNAYPVGTSFKNLVDGAGDATVATAFASPITSGGGLPFAADGPLLSLPAAAGFPSTVTRFGWLVWLKHKTQTLTSSQVGAIAGFSSLPAAGTCQLSLQVPGTGTGTLQGMINGNSGATVPVTVDAIAQILVEGVVTLNGSQLELRINRYKNGALAHQVGPYNITGIDVPTGVLPGLGRIAASYAGFWQGEIFRAQVEDFTASGITAAQLAAEDYAAHLTLFA